MALPINIQELGYGKAMESVQPCMMDDKHIRICSTDEFGLCYYTNNCNKYLKPLIDFNLIELMIPDKPDSHLQKYQLTSKARKLPK